MQVTLSTIWTIPNDFRLDDAQDEGIVLFVDARTEFDIEEKPEEWSELVAKASAEHNHIRVVDITVDYDKIVEAFAVTKLDGEITPQPAE